MHQSFNLSVSQSVNQSINLSVNLPINQSVSLSIHESMNDYIIRIFCNNVDVLIRLFQFPQEIKRTNHKKITTTSIAFENVSPLWGFCVQHIRISTALWRSFVCRLKEYSRTKVNNSQWKRSANILLCRFAWKRLFFFNCFTLWVIIVSWSIWTVHYGYVK